MRHRLGPASLLAAATLLTGCAHDPLEGAWHSRIEFTKGDAAAMKGLEFMEAFQPGGTMLESSNYDSSPPVPPAYGAWRRTGPGRYEARYLFFTTRPPENPAQLAQAGWSPGGDGRAHRTHHAVDRRREFRIDHHAPPLRPGGQADRRRVGGCGPRPTDRRRAGRSPVTPLDITDS